MKFRITYADSYRGHQTVVIEEDSYFHANELGKKMFDTRFISCEQIEPINEKYIPDFDNGEYELDGYGV